MTASTVQPDLLEIRRYPNRRLYDVTRSKTVTLDELHNLVREGYQIRVTETATGRDICKRKERTNTASHQCVHFSFFDIGFTLCSFGYVMDGAGTFRAL